MTKQPKIPTLADLRRLAKRKGYADLLISDSGHEIKAVGTGNPPHISMLSWMNRRSEMRRSLHAALSALPDAPKEGQR